MTATAAETAADASGFLAFAALRIDLGSGTVIRLTDGEVAGLTVNGETYMGHDDVYGVLTSLESLTDGLDAEAPKCRITIAPPSVTAAATLSSPSHQGAAVEIWEGLVNQVSGAVYADPTLQFLGELDVPTLMIKAAGRFLEYDVASVWEYLFDQDEGALLSNAFHQSVWPGELGLQYTSLIDSINVPWGPGGKRPDVLSIVRSSSAPAGGFSGGFGGLFGLGGLAFNYL